MAAGLGDLLQITDFQSLFAQEVLNIYHYRVTSITGFTNDGYDAILDWFEANVMALVADVQSSSLVHERLLIQNLTNGVDFVDRSLSPVVPGERGAEALPPANAFSFRLIRESLATRNGAKRYGGISEIDQANGVVIPGLIPQLELIEDALAEDVVVGAATLAEPVIVKRPIVVPMTVGYIYASVGDADYRGIGTQNTRKFGRGS